MLPRPPQGTAAPAPLPWELALALTCPLCCSPGCSRFGGVRSRIPPTPARASRTKRQQTATQTPSWRRPCSTASCSLREEKRGLRAHNKTTGKSCLALWGQSQAPRPLGLGQKKAVVSVLQLEADLSLEESTSHKIRRKLLDFRKQQIVFVSKNPLCALLRSCIAAQLCAALEIQLLLQTLYSCVLGTCLNAQMRQQVEGTGQCNKYCLKNWSPAAGCGSDQNCDSAHTPQPLPTCCPARSAGHAWILNVPCSRIAAHLYM